MATDKITQAAKADKPKTNIHPADELQSVRDRIAVLEAREKILRQMIIDGDCSTVGNDFQAVVSTQDRTSYDTKAMLEKFGSVRMAPFARVSSVTRLVLKRVIKGEGF